MSAHRSRQKSARDQSSAGNRAKWAVRALTIGLVLLLVWIGVPSLAIQRSRSLLQQRHPEEAMSYLDFADCFGLWRAEISFQRARCLRRLGTVNEFRDELQRAARLGYDVNRLEREQILMMTQIGQLREVEGRLPEILQTAGDEAADVCEAFVSGLLLNFRHADAIVVLDSWAADYPRDPQPEIVRGRIYSNVGRYSEAEAAYRKAIEFAPTSLETQRLLAETLLMARRASEAEEIFRSLAGSETYHDVCWLRIAKCRRLAGDVSGADIAMGRIRAPESLPQGEYRLQLGLIALDGNTPSKARDHLLAAQAHDPSSLEIRTALAQAYRALGELEPAEQVARSIQEAETALRRADQLQEKVAFDPENADLRVEIGRILLKYGDRDRAISWLRSALDLKPDQVEANRLLREALDLSERGDDHSPGE